MRSKNGITSKETIRILEFKKILFEISKARGAPVPLKIFINEVIKKIDKLLLNEKALKRISTINLLIDLIKKFIAIIQWFNS